MASGVFEGEANQLKVPGVNAFTSHQIVVMEYLWNNGPSTTASVFAHFLKVENKPREDERPYTSVSKLLNRLEEKGYVSREIESSATSLRHMGPPYYIYKATITKQAYQRAVVQKTLVLLLRCEPDLVKQIYPFIKV